MVVLVKVCFQCKEYVHIFPDHPGNINDIRKFDFFHFEHPMQIVNIKEIDQSYKKFKFTFQESIKKNT